MAWASAKRNRIPLVEKHCIQCGNPFHLPEDNPLAEENRCRICAKSDDQRLTA